MSKISMLGNISFIGTIYKSFSSQVRADANMKAELAAEEGRLLCTQCRTEMFPDEEGFYEFERRGGGRKRKTDLEEEMAPAEEVRYGGDAPNDPDAEVVDLLDMVIPEEQEEQIKQSLEEKTKYKVGILPVIVVLGSFSSQ